VGGFATYPVRDDLGSSALSNPQVLRLFLNGRVGLVSKQFVYFIIVGIGLPHITTLIRKLLNYGSIPAASEVPAMRPLS
jgi:hypothetical protein